MDETDGQRESESSPLRTFLAGRDVECPQCKYNLRDQLNDRCPECGEQIVLRLNLAEPKLGAFIAGLVGLTCGAGLNGLLLIYMVIQTALRPIPGDALRFFLVNAIGFLIEGVAVGLWIAKRRRVRHAAKGTRIVLVIVCWVLTLTNIAVFSALIR